MWRAHPQAHHHNGVKMIHRPNWAGFFLIATFTARKQHQHMTALFFRKFFEVALCLLPALAFAQQKTFATADLMRGRTPEGFYAQLPTVKWLNDDEFVLSRPGKADSVVNLKKGTVLPYEKPATTAPAATGNRIEFRNNDLYYNAGVGSQPVQLTNDKADEKNPGFSPDSNWVAYTKNNNLYAYDLQNKREIQLTNDGSKTTLNGYATWVYWEEIFGRATRYRAYWWSPDSNSIAYMRFDESGIPMFPLYKADGSHGELEETRYPKSGDPNPAVKLGFVSPAGGATTWVDFGEPTSHQLGWPKWTPDGSSLYVQWQNHGQDTLRMYAVSPANGSKKEVYFETQKTWIDLSEADKRLQFVNNGKDMLIERDKSGWPHLYLYGADGTFKNQVTSGLLRVTDVVRLDEKAGILYFMARSLERTAEVHLYSVKLDGKEQRQLTPVGFNHSQATLSPDGKYFFTTYTNVSTPRTMALYDAKGKMLREVGSMAAGTAKDYPLAKTELIRIKSADGKFDLPAVVTWPANMDNSKRYPMLINIYGGPDAGTVMDNWQWSPNR
jgi:dipeptidyl-peptidase-4